MLQDIATVIRIEFNICIRQHSHKLIHFFLVRKYCNNTELSCFSICSFARKSSNSSRHVNVGIQINRFTQDDDVLQVRNIQSISFRVWSQVEVCWCESRFELKYASWMYSTRSALPSKLLHFLFSCLFAHKDKPKRLSTRLSCSCSLTICQSVQWRCRGRQLYCSAGSISWSIRLYRWLTEGTIDSLVVVACSSETIVQQESSFSNAPLIRPIKHEFPDWEWHYLQRAVVDCWASTYWTCAPATHSHPFPGDFSHLE